MRTRAFVTSFVLAGTVAAITFACGCDRAWNAYSHAPLGASTIGRGNPAVDRFDLPPETQEHAFGMAFSQGGCTFLLWGTEHRRMAFLTNHSGDIVARSYSNDGLAWFGLVAIPAYEMVAEFEIPDEWFHEAPDDWQPDKEWKHADGIANDIAEGTSPYTPLHKDRSYNERSGSALSFALRSLNPTEENGQSK